ncbi:MAG TPA: J domain-containing protein [Streptosporangiaceae bacterium]|nr:J domain-containing protein [Streptosporangiaceae bacterium]
MILRLRGRRAPVLRRRAADPFALLGIDPDADLTDDEVRSAWRRIAAATHPDRTDGGDPERFAAATAAYTELRTRSGRGEARAALAGRPAAGSVSTELPATRASAAARLAGRVRLGRPFRLVLRVLGACAAAAAGLLAAGPGPAGPALATGALTWLLLTIRRDLSPP